MTLGVLAPYRRYGIGKLLLSVDALVTDDVLGTKLLDHVLSQAQTQTQNTPNQPVKSLYLHVQTTNQEAVDWYTRRGFVIEQTVQDYYRNIEDCNAHVLVRRLD